MNLLALKNVNSYRSEAITASILKLGHANTFNPSIVFFDNIYFITFRAFNKSRSKPFDAFLITLNRNFEKVIEVNLSEVMRQHGVSNVADPKIFKLNNKVFITFNTGFIKAGNDIFLLEYYPELGSPRRVEFSQRQIIEKNWSFFSEGDSLFALYSLNPLMILKSVEQNEHKVKFENYYAAEERAGFDQNLTIGTPLVKLKDKYLFIAHKKSRWFSKRLYYGLPATLDLTSKKIRFMDKKLFYSMPSLLGSRVKHNTNLISCTYFAGIESDDENCLLSYGVNDVKFGFSELRISDLWK